MATKDDKNSQDLSSNKIIKEFCYDMDYDKLLINDSNNNQYLCDIYGRKNIKFLPNVTGSFNRYKFKNKKNEKKNPENQKINHVSSVPSKLIKYNKSIKDIYYYPTIRHFEGYSMFPRPIGPPFQNVPHYTMKEDEKKKIIHKLGKYYKDASSKSVIKPKNENKGLSYLTYNLNEYDTIKHDTNQTLTLIDKTMDNFRKEYRLKLNLMNTDPQIHAIKNFQHKLLKNRNAKTINGRRLMEPSREIQECHKINNNVAKKVGINAKNLAKQNNIDKYLESEQNKWKKSSLKKLELVEGSDNLNTFFNQKDFTIGKKITMTFGNIINRTEDKPPIREDTNTKIPKKKSAKKTEVTKTQPTEDSYQIKIYDNISFISNESEKDKKCKKKIKDKNKLKSFEKIRLNTEYTSRLLKGFKKLPIPPKMILQRPRELRLKSNGDLFRENIELLRKTNMKAYLMQERKEEYDLKMLEKKLKSSTVNANNVMKGKIFKKKIDNNDK